MRLTKEDVQAYVSSFLSENPVAMPTRLSATQSYNLSVAFKLLYLQAFDRGYRIGQEDLAAELAT